MAQGGVDVRPRSSGVAKWLLGSLRDAMICYVPAAPLIETIDVGSSRRLRYVTLCDVPAVRRVSRRTRRPWLEATPSPPGASPSSRRTRCSGSRSCVCDGDTRVRRCSEMLATQRRRCADAHPHRLHPASPRAPPPTHAITSPLYPSLLAEPLRHPE